MTSTIARGLQTETENAGKSSATKTRRHEKRDINFNVPLIENSIKRIIL